MEENADPPTRKIKFQPSDFVTIIFEKKRSCERVYSALHVFFAAFSSTSSSLGSESRATVEGRRARVEG